VLAEDLVIGRRFLERGQRIATSFHQVENRNVRGSLARMFDRHSRWAKMRRVIAPACFAFEPMMSPALVAGIGFVVAPGRSTAALLALAAVVQTLASLLAMRHIRGHGLSWKYAPLELVRVVVMFGCWVNAWASRTIVWRGHSLLLGKGSTITPVATKRPVWARARG